MNEKNTKIPGVKLSDDPAGAFPAHLTNEEMKNVKAPEIKERLLTLDQAATLLGVSQQTIRNWEKTKKLVPVADGKNKKYPEGQVNKIRKIQMGAAQIIINKITPIKLEELFNQIFGGFDPMEPVNITITNDTINNLMKVHVCTPDDKASVSRSFNASGGEVVIN